MRQFLLRVFAGVFLVLGFAGVTAAPAQAETPTVSLSSPCYEPMFGRDWVYWTVTNHTTADIVAAITNDTASTVFTVPAGGSVVRETIGGFDVQVTVGGSVVASGSVSRDALTACGTTQASFSLIVDCRPSPYQVSLRIRNATDQARPYKLMKQRGEEMTGTALPGNTYITEDWVKPTDRWALEIAGYKYVRVVNDPALCNAPAPTSTPSPAPSPPVLPSLSSSPDPAGTSPTPVPLTTAPAGGAILAPMSNASKLGSGNGLVVGGLAGLLVGSTLGALVAFRLRRHTQ
ncbi:hypothetical protein AB0J51_30090 [Micromonospora echinofusca]|uniref:hypothetical protein n=1 Tax=Micromonospora echinofusca TaxID=47858 RepID=UPI00342CC887